jgi:hypothetical protein
MVQYAQPLGVAEQFEAAPEHRVVARLTGVAGDGPALCDAIDRQSEVELGGRTTAECGTELEVEDCGDVLGRAQATTGRSPCADAIAASVARAWSG